MYAWDIPYRHLVENLWAKQIKWVRIISSYKHIHLAVFFSGQGIAFLLTFSTFVYTGNTMKLGEISTAIGIILSMQYVVIGLAGLGIQQASKIFSAANRIQTVLQAPEYEKEKVVESKFAIEMEDLSASWEAQDKGKETDEGNSPDPEGTPLLLRRKRTSVDMTFDTLKNLNMQILPGELVMIVGPVGSGKSSIFNAILSEMIIHSGKLGIKGSIAYVGQDPWILSSTLRENIIMDQEFDQTRYDEVANACDLITDFNQLTHGDQTMIGDRGVNLSGGQKARVALARAVYSNKDILLLDDPLSAVDAHVVSHLFKNCILKYLEGKTRILITHKTHILEQADKILCIEKGMSVGFGPYSELRLSEDFISLMGSLKNQEEDEDKTEKGKPKKI